MCFVEAGTLVVLKQIEGDEKKVRRRKYFLIYSEKKHQILQVNEIQQGGYFGELGLINHAPRQATVSARDDVKVACRNTLFIHLDQQISKFLFTSQFWMH